MHDAGGELTGTGVSLAGVPVALAPAFMEADLRLAVGSVMPHPFAGYSGGGKMVIPGLANLPVLVRTHKFAMMGLTALDVAPITIGDDCQIGPHVQLLTPTHPVEPQPRRDKLEAAKPITIGDNVWLGGGVVVCPGVTIGDNAVIGAGSVVTRDIPANVVAVGNPARVVREI